MSILRHLNRRVLVPRRSRPRLYLRRNSSEEQPPHHLRSPELWWDGARRLRRHIICHTGPTNSGKTYSALTALREASSGIYCGPLRLLAAEVFQKMNEGGTPTCLLTGQELEDVPGSTHVSSTVEMAPLSFSVASGGISGAAWGCAVLDEAQLIGDPQRGWAWTRALLGLEAHEIHLCGSPAVLPLVRRIAAVTGDDMEERSYERLSPLVVDRAGPFVAPPSAFHRSLSSSSSSSSPTPWAKLQAGDAVVAFSRRQLHQLKRSIDRSPSHHKACIVYGGLPPDARREQARLFNDPTNSYSVLVASDAIGLGLNLSIRRVIFTALSKFDGQVLRPLLPQEVKQVAGRAGRYAGRFSEGLVTAVDSYAYKRLKALLKVGDEDVSSAGLFPTAEQLLLFARQLGVRSIGVPGGGVITHGDEDEHDDEWDDRCGRIVSKPTRGADSVLLEDILVLFERAAMLDESGMYHLCDLGDMIEIAAIISDVDFRRQRSDGFRDRYVWCSAPLNTASPANQSWFHKWAREYVASSAAAVLAEAVAESTSSAALPRSQSSHVFEGPQGERRAESLEEESLEKEGEEKGLASFDRPTPVHLGFEFGVEEQTVPPRTAMELQALEDRHSALELYQWLAIRFPRFFVDAEIAEEQAAICSDLIERGLAGMTERDFKTGSRRRDTPIKKAKAEKQKAKVRRDEVKAAKKEAKRRKTNRKAERKAWRSARAQCAL